MKLQKKFGGNLKYWKFIKFPVLSGMQIPEHYQKLKVSEALKIGRFLR